jgi:hypothetical protein
MHRVARDGISFADECKTGEVVVFVFGEIDVRGHIVPQSVRLNRTVGDVAEDLAKRFVAAIRKGRKPGIQYVVIGVVPPLTPLRENAEIPCRGCDSNRVTARRTLNATLERECGDAGVTFVPVPELYERHDGLMKRHLSDGHAHIAADCAAPLVRAVSVAIDVPLTTHEPRSLMRIIRNAARRAAAVLRLRGALWDLGKA